MNKIQKKSVEMRREATILFNRLMDIPEIGCGTSDKFIECLIIAAVLEMKAQQYDKQWENVED